MKYKIYVSDGNTEMNLVVSDLYEAVTKIAKFSKEFPEYTVSVRLIPEED